MYVHIFLCVQLSLLGMVVIHVLELTVPPPSRYPHLYPLLFSVFSAGNLGVLLVYMNMTQWHTGAVTGRN